jgi:hypothetical protein
MATQSERIVNGIKTRVLHGKDYVEVSERVRIVHQVEEDFEQVETVHFSIADRWFVRCVIKVGGKQYIGTAEIKLNAPKNTPDGTNPFECAETSALGRALAFAGLGTVDSIASYDEVARGKPFTQIIEQSNRVIEASKPQTEADKKKARLNNLFKAGRAKGLFLSKDEMALYISDVLQTEITADDIASLDEDQLLAVEQAVESAGELAQAS